MVLWNSCSTDICTSFFGSYSGPLKKREREKSLSVLPVVSCVHAVQLLSRGAVIISLSLPKECNFTHFSTVRYSDPVGTRMSSCRQPLTVGIGSQNNGLWSVSSQMFDHREELPLIFL